MSTMTPIQRQTFDRLCEANGWRCMCDNGPNRSQCPKTHGTGRCTYGGALFLVMEPDGTMSVVCGPCQAGRVQAARRIARLAKAARAKAYAEAQTTIFDLLGEGAAS